MLQDSFDNLINFGEFVLEDNNYRVALDIDADHEIFKGHFPERAILPGVVMAEILRRAVSYVSNQELRLKSAHSMKFLKMIEPSVTPSLVLQFSITEDGEYYKTNASLGTLEEAFFKEKAVFQTA